MLSGLGQWHQGCCMKAILYNGSKTGIRCRERAVRDQKTRPQRTWNWWDSVNRSVCECWKLRTERAGHLSSLWSRSGEFKFDICTFLVMHSADKLHCAPCSLLYLPRYSSLDLRQFTPCYIVIHHLSSSDPKWYEIISNTAKCSQGSPNCPQLYRSDLSYFMLPHLKAQPTWRFLTSNEVKLFHFLEGPQLSQITYNARTFLVDFNK
jgi:hypothetical protein